MLGPPFWINFNTKSQKSMAKTSIPREEKGGGRKRGRGARAGGGQRLDSSQKERKRERVGEGISMPTNSITKRLNYP